MLPNNSTKCPAGIVIGTANPSVSSAVAFWQPQFCPKQYSPPRPTTVFAFGLDGSYVRFRSADIVTPPSMSGPPPKIRPTHPVIGRGYGKAKFTSNSESHRAGLFGKGFGKRRPVRNSEPDCEGFFRMSAHRNVAP